MTGRSREYTAFVASQRLLTGTAVEVALRLKHLSESGGMAAADPVTVFDDVTGRSIDFDLRGSDEDVVARYAPEESAEGAGSEKAESAQPPRGRGRPKLGVVGKEVTLLPRHWAWLGAQRGGASAALRRLVEAARRAGVAEDRARSAQDAAYRFMAAIAGDEPGFEEAARALYARDPTAFGDHTVAWPPDVRAHAARLAEPAFSDHGAA